MARMLVKDFPDGEISDDGKKLTINMVLQNDRTHVLVCPTDRLDVLAQTLLAISFEAYNRQLAQGAHPEFKDSTPAVDTRDFRIQAEPAHDRVHVQLLGTSGSPLLGVAAVHLGADLAERLGESLIEAASQLRSAQRRH